MIKSKKNKTYKKNKTCKKKQPYKIKQSYKTKHKICKTKTPSAQCRRGFKNSLLR